MENGVDYLRSVVDHLTAADPPAPRDLKYAVLHLQAAAEVLLKARLLQEHWSQIFKEPGTATRKKFEDGDFESCSTQAAIARLRNVAGVPVDQKGEKALNALVKSRNALQHFGLTTPARAVEARAAEVLSFLMDFIHAELPVEEESKVEEELAYVRARLSDIQAFLKQRHDELRADLEKVRDVTVQCPLCAQWAVVLGTGIGPLSCRFCHHGWSSATLAAVDAGLVQVDGIEVVDCPECCEEAVLVGLASLASAPGHRHSLCFACGRGYAALLLCESCGCHYAPRPDDAGMCLECSTVDSHLFQRPVQSAQPEQP
ncbi:hypothetical protein [Streptomyces sp. YS415]|uniref:hypothetical protein n=1 Tax=Streptomyces sp. YS415 TaxID=2944806 RepID=UPI00202233F8|nr:hypothetical protein [Streptomyces sp. YS415]MCL7429810.1 hypothetical protein [Streptomyces sp. YS415]